MLHTLAQTGGGGGIGSWLNPGTIKVAAYVIFGLIAVLGGVFKKIAERNAQKAAEQARERRREEMLRTGRDETGAFVDVTKASVLESMPSTNTPSADEAKARLQQLAERRRRELAEMMKRANPGAAPAVARTPAMRPPNSRPAQPAVKAARNQTEQQARRQRDQQEKAARKAAAAAARREQQDSSEGPAAPLRPGQSAPAVFGTSPMHAAYAIRTPSTPSAQMVMQGAATSQIGAAIARAGGVTPAGASPTSAAEWRKAIILSELLHRPVSMREADQRTF